MSLVVDSYLKLKESSKWLLPEYVRRVYKALLIEFAIIIKPQRLSTS
jgi:hypothetical protein